MPRRREDQLRLARIWLVQLPLANGAWTITPAEITELADWVDDVERGEARIATGGASPTNNALLREAYQGMTRYMRLIHQRKLFSPPMQDSDWLRLGLPVPDPVRTTHFEVTELVEFELRLRGIREIIVNFWIKGADHRAKPTGYDGAVIIWAVLDEPPADVSCLTKHTMASKTPFALDKFTEEERGKTVYIALAWQNERGITGAWSEIQSAIIP
jgi:hypothetical protein